MLKSALNETLHIDVQHRYLQQDLHCLITLIQHALSKTIVNTTVLMHQQTELMYVLSQFYRGDFSFPPELRHQALRLSHEISSQLSKTQLHQQYHHFFNNHQTIKPSRLFHIHKTLGSRLILKPVADFYAHRNPSAKASSPSVNKHSSSNLGVFATKPIAQSEIIMFYPGIIVADEQPYLNGRIPLQHQFIDSNYKVTVNERVQLLSGGISLSYAFCGYFCNDVVITHPTFSRTTKSSSTIKHH